MYLTPQITRPDELSTVIMFHLSTDQHANDDTDIEIAFRTGLVDLHGDSPDFVVPLEEIQIIVPEALLEIADDPSGLALRVVADNLDQTVTQIIQYVKGCCQSHYGQVDVRRLKIL